MTIAALFLSISVSLNLPSGLLASICYTETRHNPNAIHYNDGGENSIGICQLHLSTARWMGYKGSEKDLLNPKTNIYYAGKYLKYQLKRYHGNVIKSVVAYNKGHANANMPEPESQYCTKVFRKWRLADNE